MKNTVKIWFVFLLMTLLCSCAGSGRKPDYDIYGEGAIRIHIRSDQDLNYYDGEPHTLVLGIYQLRSLNAFNELKDENEGLSKLLQCNNFDASVTSSKSFVIYPGEEATKTLDRAEGTKYVGMVTGYYMAQKDEAVRTHQIPVSFFGKKPKKLDAELYLGREKIKGFMVK
ncbi:type VI secretion system lipoprotein TssJ [Candidatus Brocadia pituitae]|nr:type VI secretion system lipoprotein TssJ [Candidatus Brocadia pituitae]